jgi:MFS family permease
MDISIVATALPVVVGEFHEAKNMSLVIVGYSLAVAIIVPVYGKLSDKYGGGRLFGWAIGIFLAASAACGFATNFWMLTVARVIQGFGGGGLGLLPLAIISEMLPERLRPKYLAPMAAVWTIAGIGGPILGGILTDTVGWRWIFFINLPIGALALLLAAGALPKHPKRHSNKLFDLETYVFFAITSVLLILTMYRVSGELLNGLSQTTLLLALATAAGLALFIWRTLVAENPVIPMRILANRGAITMLILGTLAAVNLFAISGFVPTVLQMGFNVSASVAGLGLMPMVLAMVVTSILVSRQIGKSGKWRHWPIIGSTISLASMLAAYFFADQWGGWLIVLSLAGGAVGLGLFGQLTLTLVQAFSKAKVLGAVTASVNVSRDLVGTVVSTLAGGFFGYRLVTALTQLDLPSGVSAQAIKPQQLATLDTATRIAVNHAYIDAYRPTFLNSAIAYVLVLALAISLPKLDLKSKNSH